MTEQVGQTQVQPEMQEKSTLADLNKLLDYGFLVETYIVSTEHGDFRFEMKTLTPLQETQAQQMVEANAGTSELSQNVHIAIELLSRCIQTVNGVALEQHPLAQKFEGGVLNKKREVVARFSERMLINLWKQYQELRAKASGMDEDAIKK